MAERTIKASEFKATCLKLMDQVNETGETITITKNGEPVARLLPMPEKRKSLWGAHKGQIEITGDIVGPIYPDGQQDRDEERNL